MYNPITEEILSPILAQLPGNFFDGKKVLVTGGAGFLGSWLCDILVKLGAYVVCLDNLSTGRQENIEHLMGHENFSFTRADINEWLPDEGFDFMVHGASIPSPEDYMRRPVDTMLPNSVGLLRLLEYARANRSVLLYMSTSEVYGDAELIPTPETYLGRVSSVGVRSCYDESKRFGEALCVSHVRQYDVDVRIARIFNSFGPRIDASGRYARVVPRFIVQAVRNEPLTVHGDGLQTRSFCYVTDTVAALSKMMLCDKCKGEVVNVGSAREVTILELARNIKKLTGSDSPVEFRRPRPDDPMRRSPDITKASELLNWKPEVSLEEGLSHTISWFRDVVC